MLDWSRTGKNDGEIVYHTDINGHKAYIREYKGQYTMYIDVFALNCICDTFEDAERILIDEID